MTAAEELAAAAEAVADWYRQAGNPDTPQYARLMSRLAQAVDIYRLEQQERAS